MRSTLLTTTALFGLLLATGCPSEAPDPGDPAPDWGFVSATLAANCNPCHTSSPGFPGSDPMMDLGDADLAYDLLVDHPAAETSGAMDRVEPGDSENSYVIHKLRGTHVDAGGSGSRMPEGGPFLDDETIDAIAEWIDAGASEEITSGDDDDSGDDDSADAEASQPAPEPEPEVVVTYGEATLRSFPGNATAKKLIESFSPLTALREFDDLDAEALAQMGLDEPKGSLVVEASSGTVTFEVGEKAYGSSDTYVRDPASNRVYLVASKDLSPLRGAENRLVERKLHTFEVSDLTRVQLSVQGAPVGTERVHQGRHDKNNSFWSLPDTPEDQDTVFGGFLDKALQLRASTYPTEDEKPDDSAVEEVFGMAFTGEAGPAGTLRLGRIKDDERSTDEEIVWKYVARTERTRQWVVVSSATASELADQFLQVVE